MSCRMSYKSFWSLQRSQHKPLMQLYFYLSRMCQEGNNILKLKSHGILHYLWSADLSTSFSQWIMQGWQNRREGVARGALDPPNKVFNDAFFVVNCKLFCYILLCKRSRRCYCRLLLSFLLQNRTEFNRKDDT